MMKGMKYRALAVTAIGVVCLRLFGGQMAWGAPGVVSVLDHGAVGDGTTLNTAGPAEGR